MSTEMHENVNPYMLQNFFYLNSIVGILAIGCRTTEVADTHSASAQDLYAFETRLRYNCTQERGMFPGGFNGIIVQCEADGLWSNQLPLSGCDGKNHTSLFWIMKKEYATYYSAIFVFLVKKNKSSAVIRVMDNCI